MKTLILLITLLAIKTSFSQQWCPPGAQWNYGVFHPGYQGYIQINYEKDTAIGTQVCKKLLLANHIVSGEIAPENYDSSHSVFYTFSKNDSVFFWQDSMAAFSPVYFFNAQVGNTVDFFSAEQCSRRNHFRQIIDSTGTMLVNNTVLRYYVATITDTASANLYVPQIKVVERIGAPNYIMNRNFYCISYLGLPNIRCYQDDSFALYHPDTLACDYVYTAVKDIFPPTSIVISPNPTTQSFQLQFSELPYPETTFQFYNALGQLIKQDKITELTTLINRGNLANGIYFWQVSSNEKVLQRGKVILE